MIEHNKVGIRKNPGTKLVNSKTGEVIYTPPQEEKEIITKIAEKYGQTVDFTNKKTYEAVGCKKCNNVGYYGRIGIFETLDVTDEIKELIGYEKLDDILKYLNSLEGKKGYFFDNFCEEGGYKRKFFSSSNAKKIDAIRNKIDEWKDILPSDKYNFLVGILMNSADFVSNTAGTYGAYLKIWRSMALKEMKLEKPEFIHSGEIKMYTCDVINFVKNQDKADIVYLDPPYNTRQYPAYFSVLESIVVNDNQKLNGKTGLRNYENQKSKFSIKKYVKEEFIELIDSIKSNYIVMSYSTEGILDSDFIMETLNKKGKTKMYNTLYRRFKTNSWTEKNTNLKEILFICKIKEE